MRVPTVVIITAIVMWTADGILNYASSNLTMRDLKETHVADQAVQIINATLKDVYVLTVGGEKGKENFRSSGHVLKSIFLKKVHSLMRLSVFNVEPHSLVRGLEKTVFVHWYVLLYHEHFPSPYISASRHLDMGKVRRIVRWSPDVTKWLVFLGDRSQFQNVAAQLISNLALKTVYLVPAMSTTNSTQDLYVLTFLPKFQTGAHCLHRLKGAVAHVNATAHYLKEIFPKNLNGCYLDVGVRETPPYIFTTGADNDGGPTIWTGLEHSIMSAVASALHLEVRYSLLDSHAELELYNGANSIVMCGRSFSLSFPFGIKGSHTYHFDRTVFFVHAGQRLPAWMSLVLEFEINTWLLVVAVCVLAACIMEWRFLVAWAPILETSASSTLPRLRWFFLLYLLHCLFINTSYKSSLVSKLVYPGYYPPILSVRELLSIPNVTLCYDGDVSHMISLKEILSQHRSHHIVSHKELPEECLKVTAEKTFNHSSVVSENVYLYTASSRMVDGKDPVVPVVEDGVILTENIRMIFSPRFPFLQFIDDTLLHLCEGGFVAKWWSDAIRKKAGRKQQDEDQSLTLPHLKPAFIVLLVGYSLSLLSFVAEIFANSYFQKLKRWYFQRKFAKKRLMESRIRHKVA